MYVSSLVALAVSTVNAGISHKDALVDALTLEGLIFVAFTFAFTLAGWSERGRHPFFAQGWFGWCVVFAIAAVAAAAGAAWWGIYSPSWPTEALSRLEAGGLALGIVVQPIFAAVINGQAKGKKSAT